MKQTIITLSLPNPLSKGELDKTSCIELAPVLNQSALAEVLAALGNAGVSFDVYQREAPNARKVADMESKLADAEAARKTAETALENCRAKMRELDAKLDAQEFGPMEGRPALAEGYMRQAKLSGHPDHGDRIAQIKYIRRLMAFGVREARDYVDGWK